MVLIPGSLISNRYEIVDKLGSGGMSIVYKAIDRKLDRFVTFKVMREEYVKDEDFIKRFNIEARAAASLSHPNIVNVYDVGQDGSIYYIVMEFIDGYTLKELIDTKAPFDNEEIIGVAIQIAKGLQNAHQNNIVHRDIKPENIMINNKGVVKVTDFGIAQAATSSTITIDSTMGSVYYFSPEQARGGFVDIKSDIYSLGIVMFELATNSVPFDGDSTVTIALKHLNDDIPDVQQINPLITDSIARIIYKATQKKSINRYESASLMVVDLKRSISDKSGSFVYIKDENNVSKETIRISNDDMKKIKSESEDFEEEEQNSNSTEYDKKNEEYEIGEYNKQYKSTVERKVEIAAIITSILIILILSFFGVKYLNSIKKQIVTIEELDKILEVSETEALNILGRLGIGIHDTSLIYHDTIPEGYVVSYDTGITVDSEAEGSDNANTNIISGESKIKIYVSNGVEPITVPDFVGANYDNDLKDIQKILDELHLKEGKKHDEDYDDTPEGTIIAQKPKANSTTEKGQEVTFTISKGPEDELIHVGNYRGSLKDDAQIQIEAIGLIPEFKEEYNDFYEKGKVISQSIPAGTQQIEKGSPITLTISKGSQSAEILPSPSPTPTNLPPTKKTAYLTIPYVEFPEDELTAKIAVFEIRGGSGIKIWEEELTQDKLPHTIQVEGNGEVEYMSSILKNGEYAKFSEDFIDFD